MLNNETCTLDKPCKHTDDDYCTVSSALAVSGCTEK